MTPTKHRYGTPFGAWPRPRNAGAVVAEHCKCSLCGGPFSADHQVQLLIGEPADVEEAAKKAAGGAYVASGDPVHWDCFLVALAGRGGVA